MKRRTAVLVTFAPSILGGVAGALGWFLQPPAFTVHVPLAPAMLLGSLVGGLILVSATILERASPSFRYVSRRTERLLANLQLSRSSAIALAAVTSIGEELLFRGVLLSWLGLVPQALLFGAMHPAGRKGWVYPLFAAAWGLAFGVLVLVTGQIAAAIAAHAVVNLFGLLQRGRRSDRPLSSRRMP